MTIITIQSENEYGIGSKSYMAEHIDWSLIIKAMDEMSKYFIRFIEVNKS